MNKPYPPIEPYDVGTLEVSPLHTLYYEQVGNPEGKPVVFLHGGPGGGVNPDYRRYFDPDKWRVVLFDQRGCGRSTPFAELRENTTWDLVADMERLRVHLGIDNWAVFGGSWGSTLSLAYAVTHAERCTELFLRGIFLLRKKEIDWFYQEGCSRLFPDLWEQYQAPIPVNERGDMVTAYYRRLTSDDANVRREAARAWSTWEGSTLRLLPDAGAAAKFGQDSFAEAFARIECHYFINRGFFSEDNYLLNQAASIQHIPTVIVHGRYDVICPVENAWDLHRVLPNSELHIIADAGHALSEPGITSVLIDYTDRWAAARV
ncbi:prolyl aminopeptidase [Pseudohongiella sp. SYSU M77423]|uniref:prolyl aminopeptidase n=1 Tax=Pseudohongiella sp. SYSU M77423 TaxID=3042312 RepID=UPI0024813EC9|nr:prolyl aminopeptidase [Pseudohongiella sp. SYSU M77423]MDH7945048.1 prolyl aminopeptidase [Pseudohongiella sp. SYSU M77423]